MHMKGTLVRQAARSSYKLTEARLGGKLTRQDLNIMQVGHLASYTFIAMLCSLSRILAHSIERTRAHSPACGANLFHNVHSVTQCRLLPLFQLEVSGV